MKLPIPQRGQPVDVTLLSDIVASINDLYNQIVIKVSAYASIWIPGGRKQVRTNELKFYSSQVVVSTKGKKSGDVIPFQGSFDVGFAYAPVVVATPFGNSMAAKECYAIITETNASSYKGVLKIEKNAIEDISVNIIAMGIPT